MYGCKICIRLQKKEEIVSRLQFPSLLEILRSLKISKGVIRGTSKHYILAHASLQNILQKYELDSSRPSEL